MEMYPILVLLAIWWETNKRIFRKELTSLENMLEGIERSIAEVMNVSPNSCKVNLVITPWDSKMLREWKKLVIPTCWGSKNIIQPKGD